MLLDGTALIANAIYIYLIAVFSSVVLAVTALIIRGFVRRGRGHGDISGKKLELAVASKLKFRANAEFPCANSTLKESKNLLRRWKSRNGHTTIAQVKPQSIEINEVESSATANDCAPISNDQSLEASMPVRPRIIYPLEDLKSMNVNIAQLTFEPNKIRLSNLLIPNITLPRSRIIDKYAMDQELKLVQILLNDPLLSNRCMGLFRVVSATSFSEPYTNAQHFHGGLCDLLETIIDTLVIYSTSDTIPSLQLALLDLAFVFLWEHWNWDQGFRLAVAAKLAQETIVSAGATAGTVTIQEVVPNDSMHFKTEKMSQYAEYEFAKHVEPVVLLEFSLFRLFCNLYLGTPVMAKPIRNRCMFKLSGIFYCCASQTKCHLHVELAKLLGQALHSTERDSIKAFFYEVLLKVLQPHVYCCIHPDDIFSNGSIIQKLIFQGLWTDQPPSVRDKAADVVEMLSERFHEIVSWNKSMKFTHLNDEHGARQHGGAPGSWLTFD
ncbi:hypothetical protein METBIDRAFT_192260 [Metschnikowia bicuspidata var. bicuspidata NRRL YB-4993]|uniref:Uncharacterized protein n=1 Tax=Metschnikowia bicuspidata var. bicuspidata NRRL YB-4993 TaxID=869754 RepID=A0A1A0HCN0_9ASCO|nr:hypothetical protein METBIDRAFT_192260 [Metschnikowia bicuspidata var. bicuspidata NRRL YB-4993]OBA21756.1 hypothetical protein METBIDRAFT_192260 [Metschnikowia bicuspidata var. bicuspidata NRRL YB-4993]